MTDESSPSTQVFQLYFAQNETTWASIPASRITSRFVRVSRPLADTYLEIGFTSSNRRAIDATFANRACGGCTACASIRDASSR